MPPRSVPIVRLCDMTPGEEGDLFALLTGKEELSTREGKPYYRVSFRDAGREVSFPIWDNSPWAAECRASWTPGAFYKLRAVYRETNYGPQLDIRKIREVVESDVADGFDPNLCRPQSRFCPQTMFDELVALVRAEIPAGPLRGLVETILTTHRDALLVLPAARHNHHTHVAGLLEHTLSVARTCVYLADKYAALYPDMKPPLNRGLVVAGGALHDIGKVREIRANPTGAEYTAEGGLIGHMLQGRDLVREAAAGSGVDAETLLRLEHLIIAHQRLPEWGSPKPPMTPEALLVHYADDVDAKFHMMASILAEDDHAGPLSSNKNPLRQKVFRGWASG
ncbi:MAG: HD domain-containing protein [Pirellulales bacterium]|nr:HD domain-containing protein [Pirellulales bacterium]